MIEQLKNTLIDDNFPLEQQIPRRFDVILKEKNELKSYGPAKVVCAYVNGKPYGNPLTDNNYQDDGYRFHDVFHFSYAAVLGWSPVVRNFLGKQRLGYEREDGIAAQKIEEMISILIFSTAELDYYQSKRDLDDVLYFQIQSLTKELEISQATQLQWRKAIVVGFRIWHQLRKHRSGLIEVNLVNRTLNFSPFT